VIQPVPTFRALAANSSIVQALADVVNEAGHLARWLSRVFRHLAAPQRTLTERTHLPEELFFAIWDADEGQPMNDEKANERRPLILMPGKAIRVEVMDDLTTPVGHLPTVGDKMP
jgi:hypothetical protein